MSMTAQELMTEFEQTPVENAFRLGQIDRDLYFNFRIHDAPERKQIDVWMRRKKVADKRRAAKTTLAWYAGSAPQ